MLCEEFIMNRPITERRRNAQFGIIVCAPTLRKPVVHLRARSLLYLATAGQCDNWSLKALAACHYYGLRDTDLRLQALPVGAQTTEHGSLFME
jgi:hypothetical protein